MELKGSGEQISQDQNTRLNVFFLLRDQFFLIFHNFESLYILTSFLTSFFPRFDQRRRGTSAKERSKPKEEIKPNNKQPLE
jgi:hypothetical protein